MRLDVISIFPELFEPFLETSLIGKAVRGGLLRAGGQKDQHQETAERTGCKPSGM